MIDLSKKYLLMIEPQSKILEKAVNDELTYKMERLLKSTVRKRFYKGWHDCADGTKSDNVEYYLPSGHITHSLCVHYLRYHRSEIPQSELDKLSRI